jgi:transportin-3
LLSHTNPTADQDVCIFAAKALRYKILFHLKELGNPQEQEGLKSRAAFRGALLNHVRRYSAGPRPVRTQLCLAVVYLIIYLEEWEDPLSNLAQLLGSSPDTAVSFCQIMAELPEEFSRDNRIYVTKERRVDVVEMLDRFAPRLLQLLSRYYRSGRQRVELVRSLFSCLESWVNHASMSPVELAACEVIPGAFEAIRTSPDDLFDEAIDLLVRMALRSGGKNETVKLCRPVIELIVPEIVKLQPLFAQAAQQDDLFENAKGLCRLFVETAEAYIPLWLSGGQHAQNMLNIMLMCTSHPDSDLSSMTFPFWMQLANNISPSPHESKQDNGQHHAIMSQIAPVYRKLVVQLRRLMILPDDIDLLQAKHAAEVDEVKDYRYKVSLAVLDAAGVLGISDILQALTGFMRESWNEYSKNKNSWRKLESDLYFLRMIAPRVPFLESEFVPKLMQCIPQCTDPPSIRYTGTLVIGHYADWLNEHPQLISPLIAYVVSGLSNSKTASASALSFKHLCDGCGVHMAKHYMENLFRVYTQSHKLNVEEQKEIVAGICHVVRCLQGSGLKENAIRLLLTPLADTLRKANQMVKDSGGNVSAIGHFEDLEHPLIRALDLIVHIFSTFVNFLRVDREEYKDETAALTNMSRSLSPLLVTLLKQCSSDAIIMEKTCRCWKYMIRAIREEFAPFLLPLAQLLSQLFSSSRHSVFVYIASICAEVFGPNGQNDQTLSDILKQFSRQTLSILSGPDEFDDNPEIVEDFFDMLKRYVRFAPSLIIQSPALPHAFQCGIAGLCVQHRDAAHMLLTFFTELIGTASSRHARRSTQQMLQQQQQQQQQQNPPQMFIDRIRSLLQQHGQALTNQCVRAIAGTVPHENVKGYSMLFDQLVIFCHQPFYQWMQNALAQAPVTSDPTKEELLHTIFNEKVRQQRSRMLVEYSKACDRLVLSQSSNN